MVLPTSFGVPVLRGKEEVPAEQKRKAVLALAQDVPVFLCLPEADKLMWRCDDAVGAAWFVDSYLDMMQLSDARAHAASFAADQAYCVDVSQRKTQAFCADRYLS